jgi:hypothetical protein
MVTLALAVLLAAAPAAPLPSAESHRAGEWPEKPSGKTVTLVESPTLDEALRKIAEAAGWNLVASTGPLGDESVLLNLRGVGVEEALDAVLAGTSLVATRRGSTVTVAPGRGSPGLGVLSGFDVPTGKRFSGEFNDAPVEDALRKVADAASLSLVFPPGLSPSVSGHFRDARVEDVLRAILSQAGLVGRREGDVLVVSREVGPSLVIRGGKRGFGFNVEGVPGTDAEQRELDRRTREEERAIARAEREVARANRASHNGHHGSASRVLHGDQVIAPGERAGDVVVLSGDVKLEPGASADEVTAVGGSVDVGPGSSVEGDCVSIGGDIHVEPGARVSGDAVSVGGKLVIDAGGEVLGDQTSVSIPGLGRVVGLFAPHMNPMRGSHLWRLGSAFGEFVVLFMLALLVHVLAPRRLEAVSASLVSAPLKAILTGILGTLAVPVVALLLIVTLVGIPFVAVLVLGLAAAWLLGFAALALFIGRALPFRFERGAPVLHLAIGTALLVAIGTVPVLGFLAFLAAWLFLFGVILRTRFGQPPASPPVSMTSAPPATGLSTAGPGGGSSA